MCVLLQRQPGLTVHTGFLPTSSSFHDTEAMLRHRVGWWGPPGIGSGAYMEGWAANVLSGSILTGISSPCLRGLGMSNLEVKMKGETNLHGVTRTAMNLPSVTLKSHCFSHHCPQEVVKGQ